MSHRTAIVVVSFGSHALLERHLASTAGTTDATVVVVDNLSDAAERVAVTELAARKGWHLVTAPNRGFGAGANTGARRGIELGCDVVVLLNPDLEIDGATVDALADAVRAAPMTALSPAIVRPNGRSWFSGGTLDVRTGRTRAHGAGPDVGWLSGACLAISTDLLTESGGFDEDYFLYWEDVDLSWRLRELGARLGVRADLHAVHEVGGTQHSSGSHTKSALYYRFNCRGRLLFAAKHLDAATRRRWAATAPAFAREVVLRGGRRQLLRGPAPVVAAARGTLEGLAAVRAAGPAAAGAPKVLVVAHPSPDLYGSDRQLLETTRAALAADWEVVVVLPNDGPLVPLLRTQGARVEIREFPVLRKSLLHPRRLLGFAVALVRSSWSLRSWLRERGPALVYVNTLTIPVWLVGARLAGVPTLCHVHEAEEDSPRLVALALAAPLLLAGTVMANSEAARRAIASALPTVARRVVVVHNGVPGPATPPRLHSRNAGERWELAVVGRLAPRKGIDVAIEAVALLAAAGIDAHLTICGTVFPGYEWYEAELRERAGRPDLADRVDLQGYVHPTWPVLEAADLVLVPSRVEPFGNTAVEGLLARRPVVASDTQGLAEVVRPGTTGVLVPPGDAPALAAAIATLVRDDDLRERLADAGYADAHARFGPARYGAAVLRELDALATGVRTGRA